MKKLTIAFLAIAIAATGAIFVFGQTEGQEKPHRRGFSHRGNFHHRGMMMGRRMFRQLDLTDAQKEQIRTIRKTSRDSTKALRDSLRDTHKQLADLGTDGTFDQAAVESLAGQQADLQKQLIIERQKVKSQIFAVLTPEQKTKFNEMKANFADRMKKRFERRKERFGDKKAQQ